MKPTLSLLLSLLEPALNRYLGLADNYQTLLAPLAGKVIAIELTDIAQTFYLCPGHERLQILENHPHPVDAKLRGSLAALGLMGLSATPLHALFKGEVSIEGDTVVAHKFQSLFSKLDLKLEHRLAHITGPNLAHKLSGLFNGGREWTRDSLHNFRLNLEEFLQEETREVPAKAEAELIFTAIDQLRSDADRLEARIQRLRDTLDATLAAPQSEDAPR